MSRSAIILGRRNCTVCTRWKHITYFSRRKNKRGADTVQARCQECDRKRARLMSDAQRKRRRVAAKIHQRKKRRTAGIPIGTSRSVRKGRPGTVRIEPFARWLNLMIATHGVAVVARRTKLDQRMIYRYVRGYDPTGGKKVGTKGKQTKAATVDYVDFDVVDKAVASWGDPFLLDRLYPIAKADDDVGDHQPVATSPLKDPEHEYRGRRRSRKPRAG